MLTEPQVPDQVGQAQAAGAVRCLPLDHSADELIEAITAATVRGLRLAEAGSCPQAEVVHV